MITILIVDDHSIVGEGTKTLLASEPDFSTDFLGSSVEIVDLIKEKKYDVYLLDLHMPEISGIELTKKIVCVHKDAKVLIFTGHDISSHFNYLMEVGVSGFISKSSSKQQLIRTVRGAVDNQAVIPLELLHQLRRTENKKCIENGKEINLTRKEEEILIKVAEGLTNEQIGEKIFMTKRSVERYLTGIFKKLKVSSRVEAVEKGRMLGLIPEVLI
ncbi:two-component system competent response regulator ComA [Evansella vedderi]|uniref:Two-component system competent response regulator ComA n=1 Tax=Evansella vedderi TaxID=38282 RepID=A0ABT9ZYV4_9BACI|nr:response regulator transcription factor [Evansella vedderi]MDQ0256417.1 two-component system competent response regulator ComA [Evansella vedderi]